MKRSIAFISDLHIFSRYAIFPPQFTTSEGLVITPSEGQQKIWHHWQDFIRYTDKMDVDTIVVDGDAIHGQNPIERGALLVSADLDEQTAMGKEILDEIIHRPQGNRKLFMLSGSGYHKSVRGGNPEKSICDALGGVWLGPLANVRFAPSEKVFNIQHGESAAFIYREMLLGRELLFLKYAEALGKIPHIDIKVQAHWHNFIHLHEHKLHMVQLPCWMAFEPSKPYLKSYGKMQPDIGGVVILIDDEDKIDVKHFLLSDPPRMADKIWDL